MENRVKIYFNFEMNRQSFQETLHFIQINFDFKILDELDEGL